MIEFQPFRQKKTLLYWIKKTNKLKSTALTRQQSSVFFCFFVNLAELRLNAAADVSPSLIRSAE